MASMLNLVGNQMNDQIQELAAQAYKEFVAGCKFTNIGPISPELRDRFADLLIQECIRVMLTESKWYWDREDWQSSDAIQNAVRRVKEHFKD